MFASRRVIAAVIGVALIIVGSLLLDAETPPGNVVLSQTSARQTDISYVGYGQVARLGFAANRQKIASASAIDLRLTFELRVRRFPRGSQVSSIATIGRVVFQLPPNGILDVFNPFDSTGTFFASLGYVAPNQWEPVRLIATRSHSLTEWFNGVQQYSFAVDSNFWALTPVPTVIGEAKGGSASFAVRDFDLRVVTFGPAGPGQSPLETRLLQVLAMLMLAIGTGALAFGLFSGVMPRVAVKRRPLVLVAMGVLAAGIVANVVFALVATPPAEPHDAVAWWLYFPDWRFTDYFQTLGLLKSRAPYGFPGGSYPPAGYWVLEPFATMGDYASLFAAEAVCIGFLVWWSWRTLGEGLHWSVRIGVSAAVLFSLPVTFALDRGNSDFLVAIVVVVAAAAFEGRHHYLSASLFGVAGAVKALPIFYLAAFVRWGRIRALVVGLVVAAGLTVWAFTSFGPLSSIHTQITELRTSLMFQTDSYQNPQVSTPFNTSLVGFLQAVGYAVNGPSGAQAVASHIQRDVSIEELVGGLLVLAYLVLVERKSWRAMTLVTAAILLLPEFSGYYSLAYLLAPLALFLREAEWHLRTVVAAALFGLLLAPKAYAFFGTAPMVDSSVLLTAPLLLALVGVVVADGISEGEGVVAGVRTILTQVASRSRGKAEHPVGGAALASLDPGDTS